MNRFHLVGDLCFVLCRLHIIGKLCKLFKTSAVTQHWFRKFNLVQTDKRTKRLACTRAKYLLERFNSTVFMVILDCFHFRYNLPFIIMLYFIKDFIMFISNIFSYDWGLAVFNVYHSHYETDLPFKYFFDDCLSLHSMLWDFVA